MRNRFDEQLEQLNNHLLEMGALIERSIENATQALIKQDYTIVMVTHNMQQAARISDRTAFFLLGEVIEYDETQKLFSIPQDKRTEDYITGRFG